MEGLRIVRGKAVILDNISWRVERGERWVILGRERLGQNVAPQRVDRLPDAQRRRRGGPRLRLRHD